METPPAADLSGLLELNEQIGRIGGAKVQVAEQYPYHPMQEARLKLIRSGRLGAITEATVSISHLYHGASLIRKMLGVGFEEARIRAMRFETEWVNGPTRSGPPAYDKLIPSQRELAWIDFGDRLGIYDFTSNQHRSWIRSNHISVRGQRGGNIRQSRADSAGRRPDCTTTKSPLRLACKKWMIISTEVRSCTALPKPRRISISAC